MSSKERYANVTLPTGQSYCAEIALTMVRFSLWFNRDLEQISVIPDELLPFTEGEHYISTKQVPSATILRTAGSKSVTQNRERLLRSGFTLTEEKKENGEIIARNLTTRRVSGKPAPSGSLASIIIEAEELANAQANVSEDESEEDFGSSGSEASASEVLSNERATENIRLREKSQYRMRYEDPWKVHAGRILAEKLGKKPNLTVWSGDGIRLQDPLPVRLLGKDWNGGKKNLIRFQSIGDINVKFHVIYEHTHWGKALRKMCNDAPKPIKAWARSLRYRINRYLSGSTDPHLSKKQINKTFVDPTYRAPQKERATRFLELLKTVDGIFLQRYVSYPEEVWTWERFDTFTLGNISYLIGDEFLDGELTSYGLTIETAYSQLKGVRKWFKLNAHADRLDQALLGTETIPQWCRQFVRVYRRVLNAEGHRKVFLIGNLSQSRGCGTPPPLVALQSKVKFLETISTVPPPEVPSARALRRRALDEVLRDLPDEAFTGLATKSRVTVTTSSCWENTRKEGGTCEEIRRLVTSYEAGEQIPIRDLETGEVQSWGDASTFETVGEFIFWASLDHVLRTPPERLEHAFLTVVREPGKARSVTKARACLKIVLDLVNKLCSEPLKKGIKSSTSGMAASNHGWNLFQSLSSEEEKDEVFSLLSREETPFEGYVERTETFEDLYASSTDFDTATDSLLHTVAKDLGNAWMLKCGIPALLRGIVARTCFMPRKVFFYATGALEKIGVSEPTFGEGVRSVRLVRGVLMGDPLTKVILHLVNVVTRKIGARMHDFDFYQGFTNQAGAYESFNRGLAREVTPRSPTVERF